MKIKLHTLILGSLLGFGTVSAQVYQPLTVTSGYNADVIANGTGDASASTNAPVDNAGFAFLSTNFRAYTGASTFDNAIPVAGLVTALANSAITFQLAGLTGDNTLRLPETADTGTLQFSNQLQATKLYVMATSGSGSVTITTVLNFTDRTSQTVTGGVVPDWFYSEDLPIVKQGVGRVSRADNGLEMDTEEPRIYLYTIDVEAVSQSKYLSSVQFTKTSVADGVLNVFGVTALQTAIPCIVPNAPVATSQNFCGSTTVSELTATGAVTDGVYRWYTTATGGTPLDATATVTSGIYFVSQIVGSCESTRTPAEVVVIAVPQPEGAATQYFCQGATVADITATAVASGTVTYTRNDQPVTAETVLTAGEITVVQTIGECSSEPKTITVNIGIPAPVAVQQQTLCNGSKIGDIIAETIDGATVQWTLMGFVPQPVALTDNAISATYTVTQTVGDCTSESTTVFVTVEDTLGEPGGAATQEFTTGETVADLTITVTAGNTVSWYVLNEESVFVAIPDTTILEDGVTYYVRQSNGTCVSEYHAVTASRTAGIKSVSQDNLLVYPNPSNGIITVKNNASISQITVSNLLGQRVITQTANDSTAQVDIISLPVGTYILQVATATGNATSKIIKQ
jgi:hypothetical protein